MKKALVVLCCITAWAACSKKDHPIPPVTPSAGKPLLDSMVWKGIATTTYFTYRPDSLQDKVITASSYVSDTSRFEYNGRQISHITNLRRNRSSEYFYNTAGKITAITNNGYNPTDGGFRYEFEYDPAGRVHQLTYFIQKTGANNEWVSTYTYEYNSDGLLSHIKGITVYNTQLTFDISSYTGECNFNPWAFIEPTDPSSTFPIYNLPVLQTLKRMPATIKVTYPGNAYDVQTTSTITDHNLSGLVRSTVFEDDPANIFKDDIQLFYRH